MNTKIFLLSLGCPRNLVDSEVLTGLLKEEGFTFEDDARKADLFILNTCAFIDSAKKESIDTILELAALKKERLEEKIPLIVTGCLSQRYPNALLKEIPEIDGIFGSSDFIKIPQFIKGMLDKNKAKRIHENAPCVTKKPHFLYNHRLARDFITPRHYAYVKLQEGCRNHCSYCLIPTLRGPYRSRTLDSVVKEVIQLRKKGVQEINLIGQDITLYGIDRYRSVRLVSLLKKLAEIMKDGWIRLLYTHPAHYSDELIEIISGEKPICKYLDIPVQHASDRILKRMNRHLTKKKMIGLIEQIRKKIPTVALRTTVMVGFPGETEKEFGELLNFIKDVSFDRLGAFMYSREEGTRAYQFDKQIPESLKKERYDEVLRLQQEISAEKNKSLLGKIFNILIDEEVKVGHTQFLGRTEMDAPEVDGSCYVRSEKPLNIGSFHKARIVDTLEYDLVAEVLK